MGNTVSAHIYEIKVFRPYPVTLYRLRLDHSIPLVENQLVSLGTTKIGVLDGKASTHVRRNPHLKSMGNTVSAHIYEIKVLDPTLLYCIDSDWTTLSIGGKKLVSLGMTKLAYSMVRHLHMYDEIPI